MMLCVIVTFCHFVGVAVASSVYTIMTLSVDRYLAIRHPMTFRRFSTGHHAWKIVVVIWVLSFGIMIPLILVRRLEVMDLIPREQYYFCNEIWLHATQRQVYDTLLFVFMFVMPGCFVAASYCRICCHLWTEGHKLHRSDSTHGKEQAERVMSGRRRVARLLIALAMLFAACWMPYHILTLYIDYTSNRDYHVALKALPFTILIGHSNSALNPILYCFLNKSFRKCTFKMLRVKNKNRNKQDTPVSNAISSSFMKLLRCVLCMRAK